jgi:hypothetical protein
MLNLIATIPSVIVHSFRGFIKNEGCQFTEDEKGNFEVTAKTERQKNLVVRYLQTRRIKYSETNNERHN